MARKLFVFLVIVAAGGAAYWFLIRGPGGPPDLSGLPPIQVDESNLTEAGKKEYGRVLKLAGRIKGADPVRRYDLAREFVWNLHKLGDYEGAIQWHLKLAEWYDELSPKQRKATKVGKDDGGDYTFVIGLDYQVAASCCFAQGQDARGIGVFEAFFRKYPRDCDGMLVLRQNYVAARESPEFFRECALKCYAVDPKYVKNTR